MWKGGVMAHFKIPSQYMPAVIEKRKQYRTIKPASEPRTESAPSQIGVIQVSVNLSTVASVQI
jgi:hypothetical protein